MENTKKIRNTGFSLLKILMCFEVVFCHFCTSSSGIILSKPFLIIRTWAVPVFILLSFIFEEKHFIKAVPGDILRREKRIMYPQIGWALVYWLFYLADSLIINKKSDNLFAPLLWQIATGHSPELNESMWFQFVLMVLTLLFFVIFTVSKKSVRAGIIICCIAGAAALISEYSGLNVMLYGNLRYELKYPLGRLTEMLPVAAAGILVSHFGVLEKLKKHRILFMLLLPAVCGGLFCLIYLSGFSVPGFGYNGIELLIYSFCTVGFFYLLPAEKLNRKAAAVIDSISRYTLGVYCIHRLVGNILIRISGLLSFKPDEFIITVLIFIISLFLCFLISKIPLKSVKRLVL